jgi:tRNA-modifying protein YgfZ
MGPLDAPADQLAALADGRGFADLSSMRKIRVSGADARAWLHDLVTTDVASLSHGQARRSLLLTPTGRIRADFMVGLDEEGFLLLQPSEQPESIGAALLPYVLSSDVTLHDRTHALAVFGLVGAAAVVAARAGLEPSILGPGEDVVVASGKPAARERDRLVNSGLFPVSWDALEVWRIRRGVPRMGPDFDQGSLPAEAGLEATIDTTKGCFLGQESVAKVRNLGHPPTILRTMRTDGIVGAGSAVEAVGVADAGVVTSAARAADGDATTAIVRLRWAAAEVPLRTGDGHELVPVGSLD